MNNEIFETIRAMDTQEIAQKLYDMSKDMDFGDYEENKEKEIKELEETIYYLKTIALNEHNQDYFRTFCLMLERFGGV